MKTKTKLNNIQALRAFAAVGVAVFHTGYAFPSMRRVGSFGVDVFFIISGYIMARILDSRTPSGADFFFRRRVLRIVPPYWFFTLLLFFVALRLPQLMGATRASFGELLKSLLFIPFAKANGQIQPLLFIGWSLNYEMFFYVALALGLLLHKRLGIWIGAVIVATTVLVCTPFASHSVQAEFYSRLTSLEFPLGILSYYFCRALSDAQARNLRLPALVLCIASGAGLILMQGLLFGAQTKFPPSFVPLFGVLAFLLVTSASLLALGGWDIHLSSLVLIGDASYILYLIHPYCEYSLDRFFGSRHSWLRSATPTGAFIGVAMSILVAALLHVYAERPTLRFLNRRFGGQRKSMEFAPVS
jgi:exopolysaccharide production protein ExoZ